MLVIFLGNLVCSIIISWFTLPFVLFQSYPSTATTLHFEFYAETKDEKTGKKVSTFDIHFDL